MFSKPLVAAGLVASVNAAMSGIVTVGSAAIYPDNTACWECITNGGSWGYLTASKGTWQFKGISVTNNAKTKPSFANNAITAPEGFCCKDHQTVDSAANGATAQICGAAFSAAGVSKDTNTYGVLTGGSGNWSVLSSVSRCPQYTHICGTPVKVGTTAPVIAASNKTAVLKQAKDAVTLPISRIDTTSGNWGKESCSYVVQSQCGAPVITIDSTTTAEADTFSIYVMEYSGTSLGTNKDTGDALFMALDTTNKPVVSLQNDKAPDNELDTVGLLITLGTLATTDYQRKVPGQALYAWLDNVTKLYANYATTVTTYDAARKEWDDGKRGAKPYQPTQPDAVPTIFDQLKISGTNATPAVIGNSGFGAISQYEIKWTALNKNIGKYFGTAVGANTSPTAAAGKITTTAASNYLWASNAGKTHENATAGKACDPAYVQVTAAMKTLKTTTATSLVIVVTEGTWAKNLEESIPSRPVATTAPKDSGAAYLSMGAAAALVALSLS